MLLYCSYNILLISVPFRRHSSNIYHCKSWPVQQLIRI